MGNYFKPWRRKIGFATLALTCCFFLDWFMSPSYWTMKLVRVGQNSTIGFESSEHVFGLFKGTYEDARDIRYPIDWSTIDIRQNPEFDSENRYNPSNASWRCRFHSFGIVDIQRGDLHIAELTAPHWSAIAVLTVLSAWLLLGKPRQSKFGKVQSAEISN